MEFVHKSVLLNESIEGLNIKPDGIYVDGTAGGGGHSFEIAKRLSENGRLISQQLSSSISISTLERQRHSV